MDFATVARFRSEKAGILLQLYVFDRKKALVRFFGAPFGELFRYFAVAVGRAFCMRFSGRLLFDAGAAVGRRRRQKGC